MARKKRASTVETASIAVDSDAVDYGPWGAPPPAATHWMLLRTPANGAPSRISRQDEHGVMVEHFPIGELAELGVEGVKTLSGLGRFTIGWFSEVDGQRKPCGRSRPWTFAPPPRAARGEAGEGEDEEEEEPWTAEELAQLAAEHGFRLAPAPSAIPGMPFPAFAPGVAPPPPTPGQSLGETLQILASLQNIAQQQANSTMQMVSGIVGAITGREQSNQNGGAIQTIAQAMQAIALKVESLEKRIDGAGDEAAQAGGAGAGFNVVPGASIGDVAMAAAVAKGPEILGGIAAAAAGWGERQMAEADRLRKEYAESEARKRAAAQPQIQVQQAPTEVPSVPVPAPANGVEPAKEHVAEVVS